VSRFWNQVDLLLRRNSRLPRLGLLRTLLRKPYHWMLSTGGGLPLNIGGVLPVRLPAKYLTREQETYEVESYQALRNWLDLQSECAVVDIGCSFGYFSCASLFHRSVKCVLAVDADQESLGITRLVCRHAENAEQRLLLYNCLISSEPEGCWLPDQIKAATDALLHSGRLTGEASRTQYVNADTKISAQNLPRITLDALIPATIPQHLPLLIKVDVEGAEMLVLQGATEILHRRRPALLLSVHPGYLPRFGADRQQVGDWLRSHGYDWTILAVDHEEHWLCSAVEMK